jgi:hypothetical protein
MGSRGPGFRGSGGPIQWVQWFSWVHGHERQVCAAIDRRGHSCRDARMRSRITVIDGIRTASTQHTDRFVVSPTASLGTVVSVATLCCLSLRRRQTTSFKNVESIGESDIDVVSVPLVERSRDVYLRSVTCARLRASSLPVELAPSLRRQARSVSQRANQRRLLLTAVG